MPKPSRRDIAALKMLDVMLPYHFTHGRPFTDAQMRLCVRDSFVLADVFEETAELTREQLLRVGEQPPAAAITPKLQAVPDAPTLDDAAPPQGEQGRLGKAMEAVAAKHAEEVAP